MATQQPTAITSLGLRTAKKAVAECNCFTRELQCHSPAKWRDRSVRLMRTGARLSGDLWVTTALFLSLLF